MSPARCISLTLTSLLTALFLCSCSSPLRMVKLGTYQDFCVTVGCEEDISQKQAECRSSLAEKEADYATARKEETARNEALETKKKSCDEALQAKNGCDKALQAKKAECASAPQEGKSDCDDSLRDKKAECKRARQEQINCDGARRKMWTAYDRALEETAARDEVRRMKRTECENIGHPTPEQKKAEYEQEKVPRARKYAEGRASAYLAHVQGVYAGKEIYDVSMIAGATAAAASVAFNASTSSILGIALGTGFLGGLRTYFADDGTSAAYLSAVTALNCVADAVGRFPNKSDALKRDTVLDTIGEAKTLLNDPAKVLDAKVREGLEAAVASAETTLQLLAKADDAYNGFVFRVYSKVSDIETKTFIKVTKVWPDVNAITASIAKITKESVEQQVKKDQATESQKMADRAISQKDAKAAKATKAANDDDTAKSIKGDLTEYVDGINAFTTPMLDAVKTLDECSLTI